MIDIWHGQKTRNNQGSVQRVRTKIRDNQSKNVKGNGRNGRKNRQKQKWNEKETQNKGTIEGIEKEKV